MNKQEQLNVSPRKPWLVLLCMALLYAAAIGVVFNGIGVFYTPVAEALGIGRGSFALHATIASLVSGVVALFTARIISRFGWKPTLAVAIILTVIGTSGMAFTTSLTGFYLLGTFRGVGVGLMGMVPIPMIISNWFHQRTGLAMSLTAGFSGIAGMILGPVFSSLISAVGWQQSFMIMGIIILVLSLPALLFPYQLNPADENTLAYGATVADGDSDHSGATAQQSKLHAMPLPQAVFYALVIFSILQPTIMGVNQHLPSYGESVGMTLAASGYMLSGVMLGNIIFKLIIGVLSDKFGIVKATIVISVLVFLGILILILWQEPALMIAGSFLYGAVFSMIPIALPLLAKNFFPVERVPAIIGIFTFTQNVGVAISNTGVGYLYDIIGTYVPTFWIVGILQIISFVILWYLNKQNNSLQP